MEIKDLIQTWYFDIIMSCFGTAMIIWSIQISAENSYWWFAFFSGVIFNIPTFYFQLLKYLIQFFK